MNRGPPQCQQPDCANDAVAETDYTYCEEHEELEGDRLKIYHGATSRPKIRMVKTEYDDVAQNGVMWTPDQLTPIAAPWAFDNGAYAAFKNGHEWDAEKWCGSIERALRLIKEERTPHPDFAVLPDKMEDKRETYRRSERYINEVPDAWSSYFALQDGMEPRRACEFADDLGCDGVFVGGSKAWKRQVSRSVIDHAHRRGLKCHVARPSLPDGLLWARNIGADSVDTTCIVRNRTYHHLDALRTQTSLAEVVADD